MEKEERKTYDFTQVEVEWEFDNFRTMDLRQTVGNIIHRNTGDIGTDDIAREIYHTGKAAIDEMRLREIIAIMSQPSTPLVVGAKRAVIKLLEGE